MGKTYKSGNWILDVNNSCLSSIKGVEEQIQITLEPRVMALLVYFLENQQRTIDRDELIENVWQGTLVSESAINWTIAQLRKYLGDNQTPRQYIQTLSKRGYLWQKNVEIEQGFIDEIEDNFKNSFISKPKGFIFFILLAIIITFVSFLLLDFNKNPPLPLSTFAKPFTSFPGREEHPGFSPDGNWMVFTHKNINTNKTRLVIKAINEDVEFIAYNNDNIAEEITHQSNRHVSEQTLIDQVDFIRTPSWAPHSKQITYMQWNNGQCEIKLINLNSSMQIVSNITVHECNKQGHSQVSWGMESNAFYYTDSIDNRPYQVFRFDLDSKDKKQIGVLNKIQSGSHLVRVSPTEMKALVVNDIEDRKSDFYLMNLITGKQEFLMSRKGTYYDLDWSSDGTAFYYNIENNKIYRYEIKTSDHTLLLSGGNSNIYGVVESPDQQLIAYVNSSNNRNRIDSLSLEFKPGRKSVLLEKKEFRIDSSFQEWFPLISRDGRLIYYISDRSGIPQIWRREEDGRDTQLSNLDKYYVFGGIKLSSKEDKLLGETDGRIHSVDLNLERSTIHSGSEDKAANPIFVQEDKYIIYSKLIDNTWQLVKVLNNAKINKPEILTSNGGYFSLYAENDLLYYARKESCGLWSFDLLDYKTTEIKSDICVSSNNLHLENGNFYYEDFKSSPKGIYRWNIKENSVDLIFNRDENTGRGFSIDSAQSTLVVNRQNTINADIYIIKR